MATREQVRQLLAVPCPWCTAGVGELCSTMGHRSENAVGSRRSERRFIRTLDGGCHDARWQRALGQAAPVLTQVVAEEHPREPEGAEPELVGAVERPW
jgi:hypothetical protein